MSEISPDTMQDLIIWLSSHEDDIESSINDFGELQGLFKEVFGREAGGQAYDEPTW